MIFMAWFALATPASATPHRIISLAPSITEIVYALGAGERMVAKTRYCKYPLRSKELPDVGGITDPSPEAILSFQPDLVLISDLTPVAAYEQLKNLGLNVLPITGKGIEGIHENIETIAKALGNKRAGKALSLSIRRKLEEVKKRCKDCSTKTPPKVLMLIGTNSYFCAGQDSFSGQIINLIGGKNIAPESKQNWPQVSMEYILAQNPDIIIVSLAHEKDELKAAWKQKKRWQNHPVWKQVPAVKDNRVYFLKNNMLTIPGPRITSAASILAQHIHGNKRPAAARRDPNK